MYPVLLDIDPAFFHREIWGEEVSNYLWCLGIILVTILIKRFAAKGLAKLSTMMTHHFSHTHEHRLRSLITKPFDRLLQTILYYVAINQLSGLLNHFVLHHYMGKKDELNIRLGDVVDHVFLFLFILFLTQVISSIIDFYSDAELEKARNENNKERAQLLPLIKEIAKLLLWTLSTFWVLGSVFHVNIPALITGLGIGGVAIALAGKTTVENFFAAFTILTDKPFQTGETVRLGDLEGTVEKIGFRSTRLRGSDGSSYIVPNQNLVSQNLINLTQRDTRGIKLTINIKYGIPNEAVQSIVSELKTMVQQTLHTKEPILVSLDSFGVDAFQIVVSYHLPDPLPENENVDDIKQQVNMKAYNIVTKYTLAKTVSVQTNNKPSTSQE